MLRHDADATNNNEVETHVSKGTAETARITGEFAQIVTDLLRFGRGRYRAVELTVKNPDATFKLMSHDLEEVIIGRADPDLNYSPAIDLTDFGGKLFGVSRRHATLNNKSGLLSITDHNTVNGTFVNGLRIDPETPHVLTNGDKLKIGRVLLNINFVDKVLT